MGRGMEWIDTRLPVTPRVRRLFSERIPGGASFWFVLGSATALDFLILAATGVWQLFYYVPTTDHAYDSVNFLRFQVPFGWLVHGLHYWAATAMVVLVALHLTQVFIWGAFKKPRELTWVIGVVLALATLFAMFTGTPLPWDKRGYLAAQVAAGIMQSVPLIGTFLKNLLAGGGTVGQLTLSRFFTAHVAIVPLVLGGIILLHLSSFRHSGAAGPFSQKRRDARVGEFWPDQVLKDFIFFAVVFVALVGLAAALKTPVYGAADPVDSLYIGRPEWPFLFLFQILALIPGSLEFVGAVVTPAVLVLLLLFVPWLDRGDECNPARRPLAMTAFVVVTLAIVGLSVMAVRTQPTEVRRPPAGPPQTASVVPTPPVSPQPGPAAAIVGNADHGETLYMAYCQACHGPQGKGGVSNPGSDDKKIPAINPMDPAIEGSSAVEFADNMDIFLQYGSVPPGKSPKLNMPAFGVTNAMTQAQLADVETYVERLNRTERARIVRAGVNPRTFFYLTLAVFGVAALGSLALLARRE